MREICGYVVIRTPTDKSASQPYWIVGITLAILHLALMYRDAVSVDGFFRADRAPQRFHAIRNLIDAGHDHSAFWASLVKQGNIGDYGIHAALYLLGGPLAVIGFQVMLAIAAALCVTYIAQRSFPDRSLGVAAGLLYGLLPQTLAFPHQLLSEPIANPFLIFGTAGVLRAIERASARTDWLLCGLAMGIAGLVRPALILLPLAAALSLVWFDRAPSRRLQAATLAMGGLAPFILWGMFMFSQTGRFGPGESNQDLGRNLSQSTAKVLLSEGAAPADGRAPTWLPERLPLGQYLHYVAHYPKGFANLYLNNALVMITDSGIGRLYVDLFGFGAEERIRLQDPATGWRAQLTNHGALAMLRQGWAIAPGTICAGVLGAFAFGLVTIGMVAAYVLLCRRHSAVANPREPLHRRWCLAFLMLIPVYVLATSEVVAYAPSRLRSQGEFAIAILACFGWAALRGAQRRPTGESLTA
jgi:4-amino-4-deoxy-L-arabinose transferase-like glycosyltransferase